MGEFDDPVAGARLLRLRTPARVASWIVRRDDRVSYLDYATVSREVSLDLDLGADGGHAIAPRWRNSLLLPVASFLVGRPITLDAVNDSGSTLPRLTKTEERALVYAGIQQMARTVLGVQRLERAVTDALHAITVQRSMRPADLPTSTSQLGKLNASASFMAVLRDCYLFFYLIVVVPFSAEVTRRVVSLRYVERRTLIDPDETPSMSSIPITRPRRWRRMWTRTMDAVCPCPAHAINVGALEAGQCASYHLQVSAPYDLFFDAGAELTLVPATTGDRPIHRRDDAASTTEVHVHWTRTDAVVGAWVSARLVPVSTGLLRSARLSTAMIFVLLALGAAYAWLTPGSHLRAADPASSTAILLLAPAVLATILAGPSVHALTRMVSRSTRIAVYLSCLLLFASAISVAIHMDKANMQIVWTLTASCALATTAWVSGRLARIRAAEGRANRAKLPPTGGR